MSRQSDKINRHALYQAQELIYDAWETSDRKSRVELAHRALEISSVCADAYVILAEDDAKSLNEAIELYRKGVEVGERAIGEEAFKEDVGEFWLVLDTRPYMRSRAGLARCLWDSGNSEEAIEHFKDMLRLNPNDNQGIRYLLMPCLMELGRDNEAEALFKEFEEDYSADWAYSRVLLDFRKSGDSTKSKNSLKLASETNKHVPAYILGRKKMPRFLPNYTSRGDETEAVSYVYVSLAAWKVTPGALEWLASKVKLG